MKSTVLELKNCLDRGKESGTCIHSLADCLTYRSRAALPATLQTLAPLHLGGRG